MNHYFLKPSGFNYPTLKTNNRATEVAQKEDTMSKQMTENERVAFDALKILGYPVIDHGADGDGESFIVSAEDFVKGTYEYVADYNNPFVKTKIEQTLDRVLEAANLYWEWVNPGIMAVYPI